MQITPPQGISLPVSSTAIQIYQTADIDVGDDPMPVAVLITFDARENNEGLGTVYSDESGHPFRREAGHPFRRKPAG
jgi:hypothetical protein